MTAVDEDARGHLARVARDSVRAAGGLVGPIEACELLGIPNSQRGNFHQLRDVPEPLGRTRRGQVWLRSDMEAFAESRRARTAER